MEANKKRRLGRIQNLAIILLSISAVGLFTQTQLYNRGVGTSSYLSGLFSHAKTDHSSDISSLTALAAPVRISVAGAYGRYADIDLSTTDTAFSPLSTLLREAVGSAGTPRSCSPEDFQAALESGQQYAKSVYFDFLSSLPLSVLAGFVDADWSGGEISARRILIANDADGTNLYLWDGEQDCLLCTTAVSAADLDAVVSGYQLGGAYFAFEQKTSLSPFSLLTAQLPTLPVLTASSAVSSTDTLLTALSFNPHTKSRYTESSGTEVVMEGSRSVRINSDGTIVYQGGGSDMLYIAAAGALPTEPEAVLGASRLLSALRSGSAGGAALYLQSISRSGTTTLLYFGYQFGGLPIRFSGGSFAAEVRLEGTAVSSITLRLRQYTATDAGSLLLPLAQAQAIAGTYPKAELALAYVDGGSTGVSAQWLAE